jgi:hypothetical protein
MRSRRSHDCSPSWPSRAIGAGRCRPRHEPARPATRHSRLAAHEDAHEPPRLRRRRRAGLRVYQNNYRSQLVACLEDSFARTRDWIGGEAFDRAIALAYRPRAAEQLDARRLSRDFPATLALLYPDDPEVASWPGSKARSGEAFVAPGRAIATNAPAIWAALAASETPPPAMPLPESGALIVWRDHHASRFRAIDRNELQALLLIRSGIGFAELCAELVTSLGENDGIACAGACLGRWIGDGMISRITTQDG